MIKVLSHAVVLIRRSSVRVAVILLFRIFFSSVKSNNISPKIFPRVDVFSRPKISTSPVRTNSRFKTAFFGGQSRDAYNLYETCFEVFPNLFHRESLRQKHIDGFFDPCRHCGRNVDVLVTVETSDGNFLPVLWVSSGTFLSFSSEICYACNNFFLCDFGLSPHVGIRTINSCHIDSAANL